jgi:hypothetical protein
MGGLPGGCKQAESSSQNPTDDMLGGLSFSSGRRPRDVPPVDQPYQDCPHASLQTDPSAPRVKLAKDRLPGF